MENVALGIIDAWLLVRKGLGEHGLLKTPKALVKFSYDCIYNVLCINYQINIILTFASVPPSEAVSKVANEFIIKWIYSCT